MNITKPNQNSPLLCAPTLGLASSGYEKCQTYQQPRSWWSTSSTTSHAKNQAFTISEGVVQQGQGEYLVFHDNKKTIGLSKSLQSNLQNLNQATYNQAYKIINDFSPGILLNTRHDPKAINDCANRYEIITGKIKELDPSLSVVFIPRTLVELVLIRKLIQEDVKNQAICKFVDPQEHQILIHSVGGNLEETQKQIEKHSLPSRKKCWHLPYFNDVGDNNHPGVREIAYRVNLAMIKAFHPTNSGFTYNELARLAEKEINFLKMHHKNGVQELLPKNFKSPGPTTNFASESKGGNVTPMGIRNETDAQIIREAVALDCCRAAQDHFFMYRGSEFTKDSPNVGIIPSCLSYGSSLFAGSMYDGGATAFQYMRNAQDAYAIAIPYAKIHTSPFYVPPTNAIAQLFGYGETFHGRTKVWSGFGLENVLGICSIDTIPSEKLSHLVTQLTKKELLTQFAQFKRSAIHLRHPKCIKKTVEISSKL